MPKKFILVLIVIFSLTAITGCATTKSSQKELDQQKLIDQLNSRIDELNMDLVQMKKEKEQDIQKLKQAQEDLISQLQKEINNKDAQVKMSERGLVITFLTKIFFDSGKAMIKKEGQEALAKIVQVLKDVDREIRVEGHTDNVPITRTKFLYKSNWELSSARALSVLHFFEENGIAPTLLSAAGFGEYKPVESNDTDEGKSKNRRVEIVIMPKNIMVVEAEKIEK